MMRTIPLVTILIWAFTSWGQTNEVGIFAGGANNIGDIGSMTYISPSGMAIGGIFKWNKSKRYAWRGHLIYGEFTADDLLSDIASRQNRALQPVQNNILEASAGLEVNFWEYNLHKLGPAFTPYLYTGITYFRFGYQSLDPAVGSKRDGTMAIPMTVGAKIRLTQFLVLGGEIGARYTFTDNLEGSNPEKLYDNPVELRNFQYGNVFSDDWYVFSGLTLTYTFGRKPCKDCYQ
jgi:hypothetical protein